MIYIVPVFRNTAANSIYLNMFDLRMTNRSTVGAAQNAKAMHMTVLAMDWQVASSPNALRNVVRRSSRNEDSPLARIPTTAEHRIITQPITFSVALEPNTY